MDGTRHIQGGSLAAMNSERLPLPMEVGGIQMTTSGLFSSITMCSALGPWPKRPKIRSIPVAGKLHVGKRTQTARGVAFVGDAHVPAFVELLQRDEQAAFGLDVAVLTGNDGVARPKAAGRAVLGKIFADGLPCRRPKVAVLHVAHVEVFTRMIGRSAIESRAGDAPLRSGAVKGVTVEVIANNRSKLGTAQVIGPRAGGIRAGDDVLAGFVIEISVVHRRRSRKDSEILSVT